MSALPKASCPHTAALPDLKPLPQHLTAQAPGPVREIPRIPKWTYDVDLDRHRISGETHAIFAHEVLDELARQIEDWELNGGEEYNDAVVTIHRSIR